MSVIYQVDGYLGGFQFGAVMSKPALNILIQVFFFCRQVFSFFLGKYQEKCRMECLFRFIRNCQTFSQSGCTHFAFLPTMYESSSCSTSLPIFGVISLVLVAVMYVV